MNLDLTHFYFECLIVCHRWWLAILRIDGVCVELLKTICKIIFIVLGFVRTSCFYRTMKCAASAHEAGMTNTRTYCCKNTHKQCDIEQYIIASNQQSSWFSIQRRKTHVHFVTVGQCSVIVRKCVSIAFCRLWLHIAVRNESQNEKCQKKNKQELGFDLSIAPNHRLPDGHLSKCENWVWPQNENKTTNRVQKSK